MHGRLKSVSGSTRDCILDQNTPGAAKSCTAAKRLSACMSLHLLLNTWQEKSISCLRSGQFFSFFIGYHTGQYFNTELIVKKEDRVGQENYLDNDALRAARLSWLDVSGLCSKYAESNACLGLDRRTPPHAPPTWADLYIHSCQVSTTSPVDGLQMIWRCKDPQGRYCHIEMIIGNQFICNKE